MAKGEGKCAGTTQRSIRLGYHFLNKMWVLAGGIRREVAENHGPATKKKGRVKESQLVLGGGASAELPRAWRKQGEQVKDLRKRNVGDHRKDSPHRREKLLEGKGMTCGQEPGNPQNVAQDESGSTVFGVSLIKLKQRS